MSEFECGDDWGAAPNLEDPAMYKPGGYHPMAIGDKLHHGRYQVLHRLGHGAYSTSWLALNLHCEGTPPPAAQEQAKTEMDPPRSRYVAIRISTACAQRREAALARPRNGRPRHRRFSFLPPWGGVQPGNCNFALAVLDKFDVAGPNGTHRCLVTEVFGPSVTAVQFCPAIGASQLLPLPIARRTALQLAEAVATLHSYGIAHGGSSSLSPPDGPADFCHPDLHASNLAFALTTDINSWSVQKLYEALGGKPEEVPLADAFEVLCAGCPRPTASSHEPAYLISPPSVICLWSLCSSAPTIRITDFSESFRVPFVWSQQDFPATPRSVAAPELLLQMPTEITLAIDVWALACTVYQLLGTGGPFGGLCGNLASHLAGIMAILGGLTPRFREAFFNNGAVDFATRPDFWRPSWDDKIAWMRRDPNDGTGDDGGPVPSSLGTADESVVRKLVVMAFVIAPADRASASAILDMLQEGWGTAATPLE